MRKPTAQMSIRLLLLISASFFATVGVIWSAPIRSHFEPPYPLSVPDCPLGERVPVYERELTFRGLIEVTTSGKVKKVVPILPEQERILAPLRDWLKSLVFHPATKGTKKSAGATLFEARVIPGYPRVFFTFPLDTSARVTSYALFLDTYRANKIEPTELTTFPWYWSPVQGKDTLAMPPAVLLQVDIDQSGAVTNVSPLVSTLEGFTSQIVAATTRATFRPTRVNRQTKESRGYIFIRFVPGNNYPTRPYPYTDTTMRIQESAQLSFLPDTTGLIAGPLPKFATGDRFVDADIPRVNDTLTLFVSFDARGKAGILRHDPCSDNVSLWLRNLFKRLEFYPAMQSDFSPMPFTGLVTAMFSQDGSVRFKYAWLKPSR